MQYPFITYSIPEVSQEEMLLKSRDFLEWAGKRRSVRDFSEREVPLEVIRNFIMTASSAPSGANKQPWSFCIVGDPSLKRRIRMAAEEEEYKSYHGRMTDQWLEDLRPMGTTWEKPFLEKAPWLIVVFKKVFDIRENEKYPNYYVQESTGIACGFLLMALYNSGLAALTHTPGQMNFLKDILNRPENEKAFLLIPVGYVAGSAQVPAISRKKEEEVLSTYL